jgi:hypothetical protein
MLRLYGDLSKEYDVPDIPTWLVEARMELIIGSDLEVGAEGMDSTVEQAAVLVPTLASLEKRLLAQSGVHMQETALGGNSEDVHVRVHLVCLARTLFGACCEAYASVKCSRICPAGSRPQSAGACQNMARMYKDACHAATWTSCHAQFLHDLHHYGISACCPSVQSVPSELSEIDLSDLYSRRWNASVSNASDSRSMLSLMTRCTNPGSRGWDGILTSMLEENIGTKRVCANALAVSITGLHSCIHPAKRMHWKRRMALILFLTQKSLVNGMIPLCDHPIAFKELMRRFVSNATSSSYASNAALMHLEHPVSFLYGCPYKLPPDGLECSSNAFVDVGYKIVEARGSCMISALVGEAFRSMNAPLANGVAAGSGNFPMQWNHGYLGTRLLNSQCVLSYPHTIQTRAMETFYHLVQQLSCGMLVICHEFVLTIA